MTYSCLDNNFEQVFNFEGNLDNDGTGSNLVTLTPTGSISYVDNDRGGQAIRMSGSAELTFSRSIATYPYFHLQVRYRASPGALNVSFFEKYNKPYNNPVGWNQLVMLANEDLGAYGFNVSTIFLPGARDDGWHIVDLQQGAGFTYLALDGIFANVSKRTGPLVSATSTLACRIGNDESTLDPVDIDYWKYTEKS